MDHEKHKKGGDMKGKMPPKSKGDMAGMCMDKDMKQMPHMKMPKQ